MLHPTRRRLAGLLIGGLAAAPPATGTAAAQEAEAVRVGLLSLTSHAPSIIAEARGYFDEEGLDVSFVPFQAAQPMAVAIASGDVDFGVTAITGGLISLAERGAVKVVGGALTEAEDVPGQQILVSRAAHEAGVETPADLEGKRFGITTAGSSFHYMAHKIADGAGIERDSLELVPLNAVPAVIASLGSGQIDAWAIVPNIAEGLTASGDAVAIGEVADHVEDYQVTVVFTSTEMIEESPETVRAFLAGFARGAEDYNAALVDGATDEEDVREVAAMIHEHVYADRPFEEALPAIRAGAMRVSEGARLDMASVEDQLGWFVSEGLVPAGASVGTLVDPSFVETD